jgi:hypothetical protein
MNGLSLTTFISPDRDLEKSQYRILAGLKEYQKEFNKKRICPSLTELVNLVSLLEEILKQKKTLHKYFPKQIKGYDIENQKVLYETIEHITDDLKFYFKLIEWALPKVKQVIEEGIILYEFVENNIKIEEIGILPLYKNEGYFMINENDSKIQIHRFECSLFSSDKEQYRTLKTQLLREVSLNSLEKTPEALKMELVREFKDLPNPATFFCDSELDFPFAESIFPIAKRKLMSKLAA